MLKNLIAGGMIAGVAAGLIATLLQLVFIVPLILQAELYESGTLTHFVGAEMADPHDHAAHDHGTLDGTLDMVPVSDMQRNALTLLANLATYCGFGLILAAAMALAASRNIQFTARTGALWGLAGWIAVHLATGAGLPPELPGSYSAALQDRQIWWVATAVLSAGGLILLAYGRGAAAVALGGVALALPHVFGAPHPAELGGVVPPEMAALFVARSLAVAAVVWAVLGTVIGAAMARAAR